EIAPGRAKVVFDLLQQVVTAVSKRIVVWPNLVNDFHPRIATVGVDCNHAATRTDRACKWRQHALGLEFEGSASAIRLRSDDEIVVCNGAAGLRYDLVEQKFVVVAVDHQNDGTLVDRIAALWADARFPALGEERLEIGNLLFEAVSGVALHR